MQPFQLKNLQLRNRVVMAPMLSRLSNPNGVVSQKQIDYYAERAKGGAGLIIVEYSYIDELESKAHPAQLGVYDDQLIPGLGDLTEAIQERGAKVVLQICHAGRSTSSRFMGRQPIAPSAVPGPTGEMAREMSVAEIDAVIAAFAEAARRAKLAGFDGVELHSTHGYLMAQFMSPYTNRRTDAYGRDRALFALKTLAEVRSRVGKDYLVGCRMTACEFIDGGLTLAEAQAFARRMEEAGIDYLHVSAAIPETAHHSIMSMYLPKGYLLHLAAAIKEVVRIPIIAVGALHDPALAEKALEDGKADLIAMGRALLADPALPGKLASGHAEDIRTCLRCNDGCSSRGPLMRTQRCAINAEVGRERQMRLHPAVRVKHVCVVGGGPAGMEAARILAARKHKVTLIEKEQELGGHLRPGSVPEFKQEVRGFLNYLRSEVRKAGIEVLLNQSATLDSVRGLKPDAVVLAAGSSLHIPDIPGVAQPFVGTAIDVLAGQFQPGERVAVVGGAAVGCEVAAHLASQGRKVTVIEMLPDVILDLEARARVALLQLLKEKKVEVRLNVRLEEIGPRKIRVADRNWQQSEIPVDSVVLALGLRSNQELLEPLKKNFAEVHVIGDCLEPRKIYQAVHEGAFVGRLI
jgi:2,4-dienoyl-CoA reductase-like NADH-dependent reductase (Old Yellow Enzyme family)/NADPH-dependent 2,4-dienoyl-CoA reductase/sulfur reductase-like enzyme